MLYYFVFIFLSKNLSILGFPRFLEEKLSVFCFAKLFWKKNSPCFAPPDFFGRKTLRVLLHQTFLEEKLSMFCFARLFWNKNSPCFAPPDFFGTIHVQVSTTSPLFSDI